LQLVPVAAPQHRLTGRPGRELAYEAAAECIRCGAVSAHHGDACGVCGGVVTPALLPSVVAGKFRVESRIGAGGMGVVYRARDLSLARHVALKTLPHSSFDDVERLRREARAMAAVVHPHLASIHSLETWAGRPILVCEYLPKGTLADRLKAGPMPPGEAIGIGRALAGALSCLHRSGILHRDVKPSNIGFTNTAEPKLLDFGLARILYADESLSSSSLGHVAGTLRYISPEVLNGGLPTTDADVWSLSVSLYEAVAGVHPYEGRDMLATHTLARSGKIADIREYRPETSPAVAEMFRRLLSPDPRERPGTASALMSVLAPVEAAQSNAA
jgi:serine/threonine protein kinase